MAVVIPRMQVMGMRGKNGSTIMRIKCQGGHVFDHRSDRDRAVCPKCGRVGNCIDMERNDVSEE